MAKETPEIMNKKSDNASIGHVLRISGTIVDVQFERESAPPILNELHVKIPGNKKKASLEVAQQLGDGAVRCIAIENIFGIRRGLDVVNTGGPIKVPVGDKTMGRIFNVLGETIDDKPPIPQEEHVKKMSIYRTAPPFIEQKIKAEIQAISGTHGYEFLADKYLPAKLTTGDWI